MGGPIAAAVGGSSHNICLLHSGGKEREGGRERERERERERGREGGRERGERERENQLHLLDIISTACTCKFLEKGKILLNHLLHYTHCQM